MASLVDKDQEHVALATSLVNPNDEARQHAINGIKAYVSSITTVADLDMLKLWKGLYYSLWLCDRTAVQNQLAEEMSKFLHVIKKKETFVQYLYTFARTLLREWSLLDQYRVNKFYNLLRYMLRECFVYLKRASWRATEVEMVLKVVDEEILRKTPNGPRFHIIDVYLEELALVAGDDITNGQFVSVMQLFYTCLKSGKEGIVVDRVINGVFTKFLEKFAIENKGGNMDISDSSNSDSSKYFAHVITKNMQKTVFDIASAEDTNGGSRKKLYELHRQFPALTGAKFVEELVVSADGGADEEVSSKSKQTPKKSRKIDEISASTSTPAAEASSKSISSSNASSSISKPPSSETPKSVSKKEGSKASESSSATSKSDPISESKSKKAKTESDATPAVVSLAKASDKTAAKEDKNNALAISKIPVPTKSALKSTPSPVAAPATAPGSASKSPKSGASASDATPPASDSSPFIATKKFTGAKAGYVFTTGKQGTGYYLDTFKGKSKGGKAVGAGASGSKGSNNSNSNSNSKSTTAAASNASAAKKGVTFGKNQVQRFSTGAK